ncbi:type II secretion system protein [Citricoccus zhacaiensis]
MNALAQRLMRPVRAGGREQGFTMLELIVAMLIIGILSAIAVPAFMEHRRTTNDASLQAEALNASNMVYTYMNKEALFPETIQEIGLKGTRTANLAIIGDKHEWCILAYQEGSKHETPAEAFNVHRGRAGDCELPIPTHVNWEDGR